MEWLCDLVFGHGSGTGWRPWRRGVKPVAEAVAVSWGQCNASANACEGVLKPRDCRGRPLSSAAIASRAARSSWRRSAPLERYWRSQPVWVLVAATLLVRAWRPELLPGRCRTDAAFAMLGGAAPIPASSGQTVRVRLNRSGDRQLNQALYTVVLTRLRTDPATRAYATRRRAQGKTNREIKRCLIRYVARQLYRVLETQPALDPT